MRKLATLLFTTVLVLSSLAVVGSAYAQSIPKPSVPEFTLKLVDNSYDVPPVPSTTPTYTIDPYSGKQTVLTPGSSAIPGYHVENKTIELWIKNQQHSSKVYFNVRTKGHFEENWTELYPPYNRLTERYNFDGAIAPFLIYNPIQSDSNYTALSFDGNYEAGDQIDFQVKAITGHKSQYYAGYYIGSFVYNDYYESSIALDTESEWSQTQTLTMPTPSPSPSTPEQENTIVVMAIVAVVLGAALGLLLYLKKHKHQT
jgi:hypothetical protein